MYNIGDKVLYPTHGAGIIDAIEEKTVLGQKHFYYTMRMPVGDMKVMIPVDNSEVTGLRKVVPKNEALKVLEFLKTDEEEENLSWNRRYRENLDKIKSGDVFSVAAVVKMLMKRDRAKGLSTGERKMLSDSKHILISELVLSLDSAKEEVSAQIEKCIFG